MELEDINTIGNIIDSTWGRASTGGGSATMSVKASLHGDSLRVVYLCATNIGSVEEMHRAKEINSDSGRKTIDSYISNLRKLFKKSSGRTLSIKQTTESDSFEIVGNPTAYGALRRGYYRLFADFAVGSRKKVSKSVA